MWVSKEAAAASSWIPFPFALSGHPGMMSNTNSLRSLTSFTILHFYLLRNHLDFCISSVSSGAALDPLIDCWLTSLPFHRRWRLQSFPFYLLHTIMIFPRTALRLATTAAPRRAVVAQPRLAATVSAIRAYSGPTQSEEAAKADAYHDHKDHKDMQKETVEKHGHERRADKVTASPNVSAREQTTATG